MATFNHRRFANPDALKAIHPQHLLALLQPHALYLAGRRFVVPGVAIAEAIDHAGLLEVILTPDAQSPTDLTDAFYLVHQLGVREAFDELLAEADKAGIQLEPGPHTPEDVVAQLWLRDRSVLDRVLGRRVADPRVPPERKGEAEAVSLEELYAAGRDLGLEGYELERFVENAGAWA